MNQKGQTLGLTIISSIFIFIIGLIMLNFIMPEISTFRVDLNCATPNAISDGVKLMCLITDTTVPYWIWLVFSVTIGGITSRLLIK